MTEEQQRQVKRLITPDSAFDLPVEVAGQRLTLGRIERQAFIKDIGFLLGDSTAKTLVEVRGTPWIAVRADKHYLLGDSLPRLILNVKGEYVDYFVQLRDCAARQGEVYSLVLLRNMFKPIEDDLRRLQHQVNQHLSDK